MGRSGIRRTDENRYLWRSFRYHSRTFSLATRLLPRRVRLPIATLYLFCRTVDTVADARVTAVGRDRALEEVYMLRDKLANTLDGRPPDGLLWKRLAAAHATYTLDPAPLHELLEGAIWDLEGRRIADRNDLIAYANLVGGSVGAMMLPFLLDAPNRRGDLEQPARALGIGMQLTNILRDVGEDLQRLERIYLPATWMQRHGLQADDLRRSELVAAYPALLEDVMQTAEVYYHRSFDGIAALPVNVRLGVRAAARMYREIMNEVRAIGYNNLQHRAYVSLSRKLRLVLQDDYARRKERLINHRTVSQEESRPLLPWFS